jgi:hypothetical protein
MIAQTGSFIRLLPLQSACSLVVPASSLLAGVLPWMQQLRVELLCPSTAVLLDPALPSSCGGTRVKRVRGVV